VDTRRFRSASRRWSLFIATSVVLALPTVEGWAAASVGTAAGPIQGVEDGPGRHPILIGRAVLPWETLAAGPPAGAAVPSANGVTFPRPSQPVEGFSSMVSGRSAGEYLAMEDNGFGSKANSADFLIRAYYLRPNFKTSSGGQGTVEVGDFVSFRDPWHKMPRAIVNEGTEDRLLTGADMDPESLQRGNSGDLWVGDEFGPWVMHFDASGRLVDPPYGVPGIKSPNNPTLGGAVPTQPNSRGFEAMAISPNGEYLYPALEGATIAEPDKTLHNVYEFSIRDREFTDRKVEYRTEEDSPLIADMWGVGGHRVVLIERDLGSGLNATHRAIYLADLRHTDTSGILDKTQLVDLTAIPDPDLLSLPPLHDGDVGLGDPFRITCESVETVHQVADDRLLVACDNNLPNSGRNPTRPDDNEFVLLKVPSLTD